MIYNFRANRTKNTMKNHDFMKAFMCEVEKCIVNYETSCLPILEDLMNIEINGEKPSKNIREWVNEYGNTPIHYAAMYGDSLILESLIGYSHSMKMDEEFDILKKNKDGKSAMRIAIENGSLGCVDVLSFYYYPTWFQNKITKAIKFLVSRTINH